LYWRGFLTDPVWWLYISWLPKYLADARGFSLLKIGLFAWVPYVAADAGSLSGGWMSGYLIARGWSVDRSRKVVILIAALLMPAGIFCGLCAQCDGSARIDRRRALRISGLDQQRADLAQRFSSLTKLLAQSRVWVEPARALAR